MVDTITQILDRGKRWDHRSWNLYPMFSWLFGVDGNGGCTAPVEMVGKDRVPHPESRWLLLYFEWVSVVEVFFCEIRWVTWLKVDR